MEDPTHSVGSPDGEECQDSLPERDFHLLYLLVGLVNLALSLLVFFVQRSRESGVSLSIGFLTDLAEGFLLLLEKILEHVEELKTRGSLTKRAFKVHHFL